MSTILACIDASAAARPVLQTAAALGSTLNLPVVALQVRGDDTDPPRQFAELVGQQGDQERPPSCPPRPSRKRLPWPRAGGHLMVRDRAW